MSIARQLYQLQEIEQEIDAEERAVKQIEAQLKDDHELVEARDRLARAQAHLEELNKSQHSVEWEVDDLTEKLGKAEKDLYSGRIKSPKELSSLQKEVDGMKATRRQMEDKVLELMEQMEAATADMHAAAEDLKAAEARWQDLQKQLAANLSEHQNKLAELKQDREQQLSEIDPKAAELYYQLQATKGQAVARVEQGVCRGCRISLPTAGLQRARGNLVQCGSCGRILYLA